MDPAPKRLAFLGQYSGFVKFLAKVLYCPRKTIFFCKSAVLSKKTTKKNKQSFPVSESARSQDLKRLVFFGQYSTVAKKDWFFGDSTAFLLSFLQKCCTVQKKKKAIFLCCTVSKITKNYLLRSWDLAGSPAPMTRLATCIPEVMLIGQASRCTLDAIMANKKVMSGIFMYALFRMRMCGSMLRRDGPNSQYCSLHAMFAVTGTFLAYYWFLSNTAVNQLLHAFNGNVGPRSKGAGKGKGKAVGAPSPVDAERDFP